MENEINEIRKNRTNYIHIYTVLYSIKDIDKTNMIMKELNINIVDYIHFVKQLYPDDIDYITSIITKANIDGVNLEIKSNNHSYKKRLVSDIFVDIPHIDRDISFGIELEASNDYYELYNHIGKILCNWEVKKDESLKNPVEITSPIMHMQKSDLKQIKFICEFMNKKGFTVDNLCGGHIHVGFNYFNDINELKMLYYIFCNCEYIFYLISNREGSIPRNNISIFADSMSPIINSNMNIINSCTNLEELVKRLKEIQFNKHKNINILNAYSKNKNTIEFRFPNGELDYYELMNNIILITSLMEHSKELAHNIDNRLLLLCSDISNDQKLEILLELLFSDNNLKDIYRRRYYINSKLLNNESLNDINFENVKIIRR